MKLIDVEKDGFTICDQCNWEACEGTQSEYSKCFTKRWIDDQPTVDAVPVVRCKDCRFINRCSHNPFNGNFYCADGERKS